MPGSPIRRNKLKVANQRIEELEAENERLRERLGEGAHDYIPLYKSAMGVPELEKMLDTAIANAIITHRGNVYTVLRALDYPVRDMSEVARRETITELLSRPGVRTLLTDGQKALEEIKDQVIAKSAQVAVSGDDAASQAAANFLARIAGWNAPTKMHVTGKVSSTNVFAILHDPQTAAAIDNLTHEPGDATAVQSEARVSLPPAETYDQSDEEE